MKFYQQPILHSYNHHPLAIRNMHFPTQADATQEHYPSYLPPSTDLPYHPTYFHSPTDSHYTPLPSPQALSYAVHDLPPPPYSYYPTSQPADFYPPGNTQPSTQRPQKRHPVQATKAVQISHPYARLFAKKDEVKRRKIWNHALEKSIFTPYELSSVGAPQRRGVYIASLEAHIDQLHARLDELGFWPVASSELDPYKGLNSKTAKSMVAGLQHDASVSKLKLLELERANGDLERVLAQLVDLDSSASS